MSYFRAPNISDLAVIAVIFAAYFMFAAPAASASQLVDISVPQIGLVPDSFTTISEETATVVETVEIEEVSNRQPVSFTTIEETTVTVSSEEELVEMPEAAGEP
ncbi:MAG: hypothetical protein D3917_09685 [Candidatus Electrothrix sp. AX5]|nr:hypothetical protein [Candidatus Electrothrix sp. AX5]